MNELYLLAFAALGVGIAYIFVIGYFLVKGETQKTGDKKWKK